MFGARGASNLPTMRFASGCQATSAGAGRTQASWPRCAKQVEQARRERDLKMKPFSYTRVTNSQAAVQAVIHEQTAKFIAGGTNLVDLMKENVEQPDHLVDINR